MTDKVFGELTREEKIELFTHWVDGGKIEALRYKDIYFPVVHPTWTDGRIYRKAITKPSINWDHVSKKFNYLAVDGDGFGYLYENKPNYSSDCCEWYLPPSVYDEADYFASVRADIFDAYNSGDCFPKDSLVCRPST